MKTLVIYYSRTGRTKKIGEEIANALKGDTDEIVTPKSLLGFIGWFLAGKYASKKEVPKIEPPKKDPASYDLVIIGTPIHSFTLSGPVRSYIRENRDKFNKVAFYCTCGGNGMERAFSEMEKECGKKPLATMIIREKELKKRDYAEKVSQFVNSIKG